MQFQTVRQPGFGAPGFRVMLGLREGYGPNAKTHSLDEVVSLIEAYLEARAVAGKPYLTGMVIGGTAIYAWADQRSGQSGSGNEPQVIYQGNKIPLYHSGLLEEEVRDLLTELADYLGAALGQTRVYVTYGDSMWIRQKEESETPTGETVQQKEEEQWT